MRNGRICPEIRKLGNVLLDRNEFLDRKGLGDRNELGDLNVLDELSHCRTATVRTVAAMCVRGASAYDDARGLEYG